MFDNVMAFFETADNVHEGFRFSQLFSEISKTFDNVCDNAYRSDVFLFYLVVISIIVINAVPLLIHSIKNLNNRKK